MYLQIFSTAVTALVAIIVAMVTYGQWVTNRARLRHELFDRRYEMYETIAAFLANIGVDGRVRESSDREFLQNTKKAYFVFGCDSSVKSLVDNIYNLSVELSCLGTELDSIAVGEQRKANVQRQSSIKSDLQSIFLSLEKKFEKYLRLDN